jgi:predicted RNA-binding protein with PUA-like domain
MHYWLVKQEPEAYSWDDLVRDGKTAWEGVRNYQARNNLQQMKLGDQVLFYHSVGPREVVGIAEVCREAFPDATADDPRWIAVELKPLRPLKNPVTLDEIKQTPALKEVALIKQSRLSVMPLAPAEFDAIVKLGR